MRTRTKAMLAALAAASMMFALVANAAAREFRVTEREIEVLFERARPLTFEAAGNNISCPLTF